MSHYSLSVTEETGKAKPNLNVLAEWRRREAEYLERAKDLETVTSARDQAKQRYDDLRKARLEGFMTGFNAISSKLKEMYQVSHRLLPKNLMWRLTFSYS